MKEQPACAAQPAGPEKLVYQKPEVTEIEMVAFDVLSTTCTPPSFNGGAQCYN